MAAIKTSRRLVNLTYKQTMRQYQSNQRICARENGFVPVMPRPLCLATGWIWPSRIRKSRTDTSNKLHSKQEMALAAETKSQWMDAVPSLGAKHKQRKNVANMLGIGDRPRSIRSYLVSIPFCLQGECRAPSCDVEILRGFLPGRTAAL